MGWQDTNNRKAADITGKIEGNTIRGIVLVTSTDDRTHVYEFSLYKNESSADKWGFYDSVHGKFLCAHHLDQNGIELESKTTQSRAILCPQSQRPPCLSRKQAAI